MRSIRTRRWVNRGKGSIVAMSVGMIALQGCTMVSSHKLTTSNHLSGASATYTLPKTLVKLKRDVNSPGITISTVSIADPEHTYALEYTESPMSEDDLKIELDSVTGFIKSVNGTASDKTAEVLEEVSKTAARIASGGLYSGADVAGAVIGTKSVMIKPFEIIFDPSEKAERDRAAIDLSNATGGQLNVIRCEQCTDEKTKALPGTVEGIVTRPAKFVRIDLCAAECSPATVVASNWVKTYSGSPLVLIPVERSIAVARKTTLTFSDGVVTKAEHDKPSEAAGVVAIPGKIISAVFAGLLQGETDKQSILDAGAKSVESQAKLIEAQAKLLKAQTDYKNAVSAAEGALNVLPAK